MYRQKNRTQKDTAPIFLRSIFLPNLGFSLFVSALFQSLLIAEMQRLQRLKTGIHSAPYASLRYNTGLKMKRVATSGSGYSKWLAPNEECLEPCEDGAALIRKGSVHVAPGDLSICLSRSR